MGTISLDLLRSQWHPTYTVDTLLMAIRGLLIAPDPTSPANISAAVLFTNDPREYERHIRNFVQTTWSH